MAENETNSEMVSKEEHERIVNRVLQSKNNIIKSLTDMKNQLILETNALKADYARTLSMAKEVIEKQKEDARATAIFDKPCVKCGGTTFDLTFINKNDTFNRMHFTEETIYYTCKRCGYKGYTKPLDAAQ